jgi:protein-S-isoprenylcysteine O-methyltransferase Ste14
MLSYMLLQVAFLCLLAYRATLEEAKLSGYSTEYKEYKARTPMLLPRVWPDRRPDYSSRKRNS